MKAVRGVVGLARELKIVLGSVTDAVLMDQVMRDHEINTIFHAAAYKHVPLVEDNPFAGIDTSMCGEDPDKLSEMSAMAAVGVGLALRTVGDR